jgi:hypothetical protein
MRPRMELSGLLSAAAAWADHGGPLRPAGSSPLVTGVLSGLLALAAGVLIVIIVMRVIRR